MSTGERVLVAAPLGRDAQLATRVLAEARIEAVACSDLHELAALLDEGAGAVLITAEALAGSGAAVLRERLARQPTWSDVPILVFGAPEARNVDLGNVTHLDRPVSIRTLVSTLQASLRARRRQYETRDLLERLARSVQERDQFLAMLGHELRNPLAAILTASELLDHRGDPSLSRERSVIGRQARHLARLVDDLLDVARVTAGKITLHLETLELRSLAQRVLHASEAAARRAGLGLSLSAREPVVVRGDPLRLEQVLTNLVSNAIKYTPHGGQVRVELEASGEHAVVRVCDDGMGITAEMLPRVFDLFAQAPASLDRAQGGMGIGLTLVQRLVALHGGRVTAHSDGAGRGTTMTLHFPLHRDAHGAVETRAPAPWSARRGRSVLLVEDNADAREVLQIALELLGYRVTPCEDGASAIAHAASEPPDALVVDLGLPGRNGYEVASAVRGLLGPAVRLVALTGYGQPDDRARAEAAGFDAFLTKPAEVEAIARALDPGEAATAVRAVAVSAAAR